MRGGESPQHDLRVISLLYSVVIAEYIVIVVFPSLDVASVHVLHQNEIEQDTAAYIRIVVIMTRKDVDFFCCF